MVQQFDTPHGLDTPTFLPLLGLAVCGSTGKMKQRTKGGVAKSYQIGHSLHLFRHSSDDVFAYEQRPLGSAVSRCVAVDPVSSELIVVAVGGDNGDEELVVLHPNREGELARVQAKGLIQRFHVGGAAHNSCSFASREPLQP